MVNVPNVRKAMAFTTAAQNHNIVNLGFDWRHFGDISQLLSSIDEFIDNPDTAFKSMNLYGFAAKSLLNKVDISWNMLNGSSISRFELERANVINSQVGTYNIIESINSINGSNADVHYQTIDKDVFTKKVYSYRLKLVDIDGSYSYSESKIVEIGDIEFIVGDIIPNPVDNISTINLINNIDQDVKLSIYDLSGKELVIISDGLLKVGEKKFDINSGALPSGNYNLVINVNGRLFTKPFNVAK
jgi:hypothetical protein